MGRKILRSIGILFWLMATSAFVVSMITKVWRATSQKTFNLFEDCPRNGGGITFSSQGCNPQAWEIGEVPNYILVPRVLMLVAAFFVLVSTAFGLSSLCSDSNCPIISEGALCVVAGMFVLAACSVFTALSHQRSGDFGYSFYLGWIAGAMYVMAGAFASTSGSMSS